MAYKDKAAERKYRREWAKHRYESDPVYRQAAIDAVQNRYYSDHQESLARRRAWAKANPEKIQQQNRKQYLKNRKATIVRVKDAHRGDKILVLEAYGRVCIGCGCADVDILQLDHINNDGGGRDRELQGSRFYRWLVKHNFPAEPKLQVMCPSCHIKKTRLGSLPTPILIEDGRVKLNPAVFLSPVVVGELERARV